MLMWEVTIAQEVTHFMGYQIFMSKPANYEEGNIGGALIRLDSVTQCHAFYFHGAMMATPIYLRQIQHIQQVTCVAPFQTDCELSSQTGTMYYGKAMDGTYFVEKQFSTDQQGLPSGILLFMIPPDYYEEVLLRLISLPNLPLELLNQNCDGFEEASFLKSGTTHWFDLHENRPNLFSLEGTNLRVCSHEVKDAIEKAKLTNVYISEVFGLTNEESNALGF